MSLGTWGLSGDAYGDVALDDARVVIERSLELGFTLFDTSDAYGAGAMEKLLGEVLAPHDAVTIVTKAGIDRSTDPPRKRFDLDYLRASAERSLKRLRRDRLDVFLLHNPSADALWMGGAAEAMKQLKKDGVISYWGVSAGDAEVARAAIEKGADVLEIAYNLIHSEDLHRLAGELMISRAGVLARSTLSYGLLAGYFDKSHQFPDGDHRGSRWTRPEFERRVEQLDALRFLIRGDVPTLRSAAVRFVLSNQLVSAAILGPKSVEQLEQLVREVGSGPRYLSDEALADLPRALDRVGIQT